MIKYRYLLLLPLLLLLLRSNGPRKGGQEVQEALGALKNDPSMEGGSLGFLAVDLSTGKRLAVSDADRLLLPASTLKLLSTSLALELLGSDHRFRTVLGYRGTVEDSVLHGDLILRGGGDPAFASKHFQDHYGTPKELFERFAKAYKAKGIRGVEGGLLGDAGHFPKHTLSRGRIWEDMGNYFGAFPSGLSYRDNSFELHFSTPDRAGEPARSKGMRPEVPGLRIENRVKSADDPRDRAYIFGKPYDRRRVVEGTLPKGKEHYSIEGSLPDPAAFAAHEGKGYLEGAGIRIQGKANSIFSRASDREFHAIDTVYSPPLRELVRITNRKSVNLFAEHFLLSLGKEIADTAKPGPAGEAILEHLEEKGFSTKGIRIADGSGLAPMNRVSAEFLVGLLERAWKGPYKETFANSLGIAGKSGTMRYVGDGTLAEGKLRAKSGSMEGIRSYAGYAERTDGNSVAFALIANDFSCSGSEMREKMEPVLVSLVR